jgi:hypothetical protein
MPKYISPTATARTRYLNFKLLPTIQRNIVVSPFTFDVRLKLSVAYYPCHAGSIFFVVKHSAGLKKDSSGMTFWRLVVVQL